MNQYILMGVLPGCLAQKTLKRGALECVFFLKNGQLLVETSLQCLFIGALAVILAECNTVAMLSVDTAWNALKSQLIVDCPLS